MEEVRSSYQVDPVVQEHYKEWFSDNLPSGWSLDLGELSLKQREELSNTKSKFLSRLVEADEMGANGITLLAQFSGRFPSDEVWQSKAFIYIGVGRKDQDLIGEGVGRLRQIPQRDGQTTSAFRQASLKLAPDYFEQAIELARDINKSKVRDEAITDLGDHLVSKEMIDEAETLLPEIRSSEPKTRLLLNIFNSYLDSQDIQNASRVAKTLTNFAAQATCYIRLAEVVEEQEEAQRFLNRALNAVQQSAIEPRKRLRRYPRISTDMVVRAARLNPDIAKSMVPYAISYGESQDSLMKEIQMNVAVQQNLASQGLLEETPEAVIAPTDGFEDNDETLYHIGRVTLFYLDRVRPSKRAAIVSAALEPINHIKDESLRQKFFHELGSLLLG